MKRKWEVRFSGTGGQGIIRSAVLLAQAALYDGFDATQSQSYGPESRGGSTKGEVVIDDNIIYYPKVDVPNIVLCMSKQAYNKYANELQVGGCLIVDSSIKQKANFVSDDVKVQTFPIIETAREELQNELSANIVALGIMIGLTDIVTYESMVAAIEVNFKSSLIPVNIKALDLGIKMGKGSL